MDLKDSHTCMESFTDHSVLPCEHVYTYCYCLMGMWNLAENLDNKQFAMKEL
jgi:hypothetical protein